MRKFFEIGLKWFQLWFGKKKQNRRLLSFALCVSLVLHVLVFVAAAMFFREQEIRPLPVHEFIPDVIQARAIGVVEVERWQAQREQEKLRIEREKQRVRQEIRRKAEEASQKKQAQRQAEVKAAERARRKKEARRKAEAAKAAKAAKQAHLKQEAQRKAAEQARLKEEARRKAEAAKASEEARLKAVAEARRKAEEEARRKKEARRKAEEAKRKAELAAQFREQEETRRRRELALLTKKYVRDIENKIRSVWSVPPGGFGHGDCTIRLKQDRAGIVHSVKIQVCDANHLYRQSLEEAVLKAAPLPLPGIMEIFDEEVEVTFRLQ